MIKELTTEIQEIKGLCEILMTTKHYASIGQTGIFSIIQKCKYMNIDPLEGLNGGMYFVNGKVEMSSILMCAQIRNKGHSITCSENTDQVCILKGTRKDNGDTWTVSFTMEHAKRAGLLGKDPWKKYPDIMLYCRALSKLARQLFPDVIGNCYIQGEIDQENESESPTGGNKAYIDEKVMSSIEKNTINITPAKEDENFIDITLHCERDPEIEQRAACLIEAGAFKSLRQVPRKIAQKLTLGV